MLREANRRLAIESFHIEIKLASHLRTIPREGNTRTVWGKRRRDFRSWKRSKRRGLGRRSNGCGLGGRPRFRAKGEQRSRRNGGQNRRCRSCASEPSQIASGRSICVNGRQNFQRLFLDLSDEPVAAPRQGLDVTGGFR